MQPVGKVFFIFLLIACLLEAAHDKQANRRCQSEQHFQTGDSTCFHEPNTKGGM